MIDENAHSHYGYQVDLSVAETLAALSSPVWRVVEDTDRAKFWPGWPPSFMTEIEFRGEWMEMCRTDLKDDVCTGNFERKDEQDPVKRYRDSIRYGARVRKIRDGGLALKKQDGSDAWLFAVVDQFSDG